MGEEDWRDFYKEYYDVVRDWHKQGFITIHQWRNFVDYLNMFVRKKLKEQAKKIFEEIEKANISADISDHLAVEGDTWQDLKKQFGGGR